MHALFFNSNTDDDWLHEIIWSEKGKIKVSGVAWGGGKTIINRFLRKIISQKFNNINGSSGRVLLIIDENYYR